MKSPVDNSEFGQQLVTDLVPLLGQRQHSLVVGLSELALRWVYLKFCIVMQYSLMQVVENLTSSNDSKAFVDLSLHRMKGPFDISRLRLRRSKTSSLDLDFACA